MSSSSQFYRLITLSDRVVPGFAGIMHSRFCSRPFAVLFCDFSRLFSLAVRVHLRLALCSCPFAVNLLASFAYRKGAPY
jgi:hypothetical protein